MSRKILGRILQSALLMFVLMTAVFFLIRFAPGGPFDGERVLPREVQAQIDARFGLDAPVLIQYGRWLGQLASGDLGYSFQYTDQRVTEIIASALPTSMGLGLVSLLLAMGCAIPLGVIAATRRESFVDRGIRLVVLSSVSLPGFLVASLLVWIFSLQLGWLPPGLWESLWVGPEYWVLPTFTLSLRPMALLVRQVRGSVLDSLQNDYIRTARSKGLGERSIIWKHALRNAWIPVLGILPPMAAHLLTGSFLVETVFQVPGLGRAFVSSVINRDYGLIMGTTLTFGILLSLFTLAGDLLLTWADPRLRGAEEGS